VRYMSSATNLRHMIRRGISVAVIAAALAVPAAAAAATSPSSGPAKSCKSVTSGITYLTIGRLGAKTITCQEANVVSNTWMLRFKAHMQVQSFKVNSASYQCKLVPTLPRNTQCDGGGTRIKFSAPTGG
jgi:hypothetical protein